MHWYGNACNIQTKKSPLTKQLPHTMEIKHEENRCKGMKFLQMLTTDPKITSKNKIILMFHVFYLNKHASSMKDFPTHNSLPREKEVENTLWITSFHI